MDQCETSCSGSRPYSRTASVWNGLGRLRKDNTGYDLKHLLIGSEGTLGVITAVVLKLFPKPRSSVTALVGVPDLDAALALLSRLRTDLGNRVSNFEVMSSNEFALVLSHNSELSDPLGAPSPWYAFIEAADMDAEANLVQGVERC